MSDLPPSQRPQKWVLKVVNQGVVLYWCGMGYGWRTQPEMAKKYISAQQAQVAAKYWTDGVFKEVMITQLPE